MELLVALLYVLGAANEFVCQRDSVLSAVELYERLENPEALLDQDEIDDVEQEYTAPWIGRTVATLLAIAWPLTTLYLCATLIVHAAASLFSKKESEE